MDARLEILDEPMGTVRPETCHGLTDVKVTNLIGFA